MEELLQLANNDLNAPVFPYVQGNSRGDSAYHLKKHKWIHSNVEEEHNGVFNLNILETYEIKHKETQWFFLYLSPALPVVWTYVLMLQSAILYCNDSYVNGVSAQ